MKWDQGLLAGFMTIGFTLLGVGACGPSRTEVRMLPTPRLAKAQHECAAKLGTGKSQVIGDKTSRFASVCGFREGTRGYAYYDEPIGYNLENNRGRLDIRVSLRLSMPQTSPRYADAALLEIRKVCDEKIEGLWGQDKRGPRLQIQFLLGETANSRRDRENEDVVASVHDLTLVGNPQKFEALHLEHWPEAAGFHLFESEKASDQCIARNAGIPAKIRACQAEAKKLFSGQNLRFCANLAVMVGHYLGLSEDSQRGSCEPKIEPDPEEGSVTLPAQIACQPPEKPVSFMEAANLKGNEGECFWKNVSFAAGDKKKVIFAGACAVHEKPGAGGARTIDKPTLHPRNI